jgi:hypothetical protein
VGEAVAVADVEIFTVTASSTPAMLAGLPPYCGIRESANLNCPGICLRVRITDNQRTLRERLGDVGLDRLP